GAVSLSADGRFVAFVSVATNLTPEGRPGVFVHDRGTRVTEWVIAAYASQLSLSADGRFVAFGSYATNLVAGDTNGQHDVFIRDRLTGTTERVSLSSTGNQGDGWSSGPSLSADGRFVAFTSGATNLVPGDTNGASDVFVHDRQTGITERV